MNIERRLHIVSAAVAALAIYILAMGERNPLLGLVGVLVCGAGLVINDFLGRHLNTFWGNLAALGALAFALFSFNPEDAAQRLIAMANLLIYAQLVLCFRERNPQAWWMVLLLSLLQICVASVLINDFYFGLLLILYMLLATYMVALLTFRRENYDAMREGEKRKPFSWKFWLPPEVAQHASLLGLGRKPPPATGDKALRWTMLRQPARFTARQGKRKEVDLRGLFSHWLRMCLLTLVVVPPLFALLPRIYAENTFMSGPISGLNSVGFSEQVSLGDLGMILESPEEVMRVTFRSPITGDPIKLMAGQEPLFRGVTYSSYDKGKWKLYETSTPAGDELEDLGSVSTYVVQDISIVPENKHNYLFGVYPVYRASGYPGVNNVKWDSTHQAMKRAGDRTRETHYTVLTTGIKSFGIERQVDANRNSPGIRELTDFDATKLPLVKREADAFAATLSEEIRNDPQKLSEEFEKHLRDSGEFSYTLRAPFRNPNMDNIEDFLTENKVGHCEFFASALTLMLRSQGVPARMVNGYKGGDWNTLGEFYQVRQLHAHTWVEVLIQPDGNPANKKWLILDPTPSTPSVQTSMWSSFRQFSDYIQHVWSSYVLGMNRDSQESSVYNELFNANAWKSWMEEIKQLLSGEMSLTGFLNIRLVFMLIFLPMAFYGLYRLTAASVRVLNGTRGPAKKKARTAAQAQVEFYRRFEAILAQRRLRREAAQTQREFAMSIGGQFSGEEATRGLSPIPRFVVDAFYRVRFGNHPLATAELDRLTGELDRLEASMPKVNGQAK